MAWANFRVADDSARNHEAPHSRTSTTSAESPSNSCAIFNPRARFRLPLTRLPRKDW